MADGGWPAVGKEPALGSLWAALRRPRVEALCRGSGQHATSRGCQVLNSCVVVLPENIPEEALLLKKVPGSGPGPPLPPCQAQATPKQPDSR